jgi:hypothetical protein
VLFLIQLFPAWHDEKADDAIITMNKAAPVEDTVAIVFLLMSSGRRNAGLFFFGGDCLFLDHRSIYIAK